MNYRLNVLYVVQFINNLHVGEVIGNNQIDTVRVLVHGQVPFILYKEYHFLFTYRYMYIL